MTSTSLQTSASPSNYNYSHCLSHWCAQTHCRTHTCLLGSEFQNTSGLPASRLLRDVQHSFLCCESPPPSSISTEGRLRGFAFLCWWGCCDVRGPFALGTMTHAHHQWNPTPSSLAYPHTVSPTGLLNFTFSHSPVDSRCCTISAVMGCMGLLLCKVSTRGREGWKTTTTVWGWGPEYESWSEWKWSSTPPVTFLASSRAGQHSLSLISIQENKSTPETF